MYVCNFSPLPVVKDAESLRQHEASYSVYLLYSYKSTNTDT
jgi:hypothetical protein